MSAAMETPKAVRVAEAYCYDAGAPNAAKNLRAAVAELIAERDALREDVERLQADGVHTCGPHCQRIACVLRRENAALRAAAGHNTPAPPDGILRGNADLVPTAHATLGAPEQHA